MQTVPNSVFSERLPKQCIPDGNLRGYMRLADVNPESIYYVRLLLTSLDMDHTLAYWILTTAAHQLESEIYRTARELYKIYSRPDRNYSNARG